MKSAGGPVSGGATFFRVPAGMHIERLGPLRGYSRHSQKGCSPIANPRPGGLSSSAKWLDALGHWTRNRHNRKLARNGPPENSKHPSSGAPFEGR